MSLARTRLGSLSHILIPHCTAVPQTPAVALSSRHLAQKTVPVISSRSIISARKFATSQVFEMPQMPVGIVTGGKDNLKLSNADLVKNHGYVNGSWIEAKSGKKLDVLNKASQAVIGQVPDMNAEDTKAAIEAAVAALPAWRGKSPKERSDLLYALYDELQKNAEDLAKIIVAENGKTFAEAKSEVAYSNSFIQWFAAESMRTYGHVAPSSLPDVRNVIVKQPVGVVGLITPWNFPAAMITRKMGPALAVGCTAIVKAPAETPFSALALAHLADKVGIPKGVFNVVTCTKGDNEAAVGKELCENPRVKKISFTGSTRVGKLLFAQCASTLKKMSMELGGNAPFVVFEDANLDKAVEGAIVCKFRGSGQTCVCANRIYVQESVHDEFVKRFATKVEQFKVGNGLDPSVTHGPLVNHAGLQKVEQHVDESIKGGAKVLVGGKRGEGNFFEPTVLTNLPHKPPTDFEETFGPLASVYKFTSEEEVVKKCNDVPVGLAGYFFTQDVHRAWRVAEAMEVGMVGLNTGLLSQMSVPFGGIKESGFGREGGRDGINDFTVDKLMVWG